MSPSERSPARSFPPPCQGWLTTDTTKLIGVTSTKLLTPSGSREGGGPPPAMKNRLKNKSRPSPWVGTGRGQQGTDDETDGSEGGGADCHAEQNAETRLRKGEIGGDEPDGDRKAGSDQDDGRGYEELEQHGAAHRAGPLRRWQPWRRPAHRSRCHPRPRSRGAMSGDPIRRRR